MAREGRGLFTTIWRNFLASFKSRESQATLIGNDHFGNRYYESKGAKNRNPRWFMPSKGESNFDQEIPPEWEAWLRNRRTDPPTPEEIQKNLALIETKKKNAAKIDKKFNSPSSDTPVTSFPRFNEYEIYPGKEQEGKSK